MQRTDFDIMRKMINGDDDVDIEKAIIALIDKKNKRISPPEGQLIDFKEMLIVSSPGDVGELARDILGFSNADGGILLFGVDDSGQIVGTSPLETKILREYLGVYLGTRVEYETHLVDFNGIHLPTIVVLKNKGLHPHLLRKEIELRTGVLRKIKYASGSLFYRKDDKVFVEPHLNNIDEKASELGFTGAAPRTDSAFLFAKDTVGMRIYAPSSTKIIGRDHEVSKIALYFDDLRGRGVSLAGLGGVGKTELAIRVVDELFKRKKFKAIYSGSAKVNLLVSLGSHKIDPIFEDMESLLRDIGSWLGLDVFDEDMTHLEEKVLKNLKEIGACLLFIDNLETVTDKRVFDFIDNKLPDNCWKLTTSRIHKVKNYIRQEQVEPLQPEFAAKMLRSELKNNGLELFASQDINKLQDYAVKLHGHPLGIKFFAWHCKKRPEVWEKGPVSVPMGDLESFCVAHTLQNLTELSRKILCSLIAIMGHTKGTVDCISKVSGVSGDELDQSLVDLEASGMVHVQIEDGTGHPIYYVTPLAEKPARELGQQEEWEVEFVRKLKSYQISNGQNKIDDPRVIEFREYPARNIRKLSPQEREVFLQRIKRVESLANDYDSPILWALKAECLRHSLNIASSDDEYSRAAEAIIHLAPKEKYQGYYSRILIEAATVARSRYAKNAIPASRIIKYLEHAGGPETRHTRVVGMLVQAYRFNNEADKMNSAIKIGREILAAGSLSPFLLDELRNAIEEVAI